MSEFQIPHYSEVGMAGFQNSGGRALKPQEIRACIYYGEFNELLGELVKSQSWRAIFGKKPDIRLKEQELILRFFSLLYNRENYEKPLKGFLNAFMSEHQHLEKIPKEEFENTFKNTFDFIATTVGNKPFRIKRNLNLGAFDSISIGVAERLKSGKIKNKAEFVEKYRLLTENEEFISVVQGGTSDEKNVIARINMAIESFKNLD